ncbi:homoserine O-succinyltransferase MetA [Rhodopseudomonas pseudopalustris]|uniref:Homoserine O-succinyltransferase n=2 Tax=Rhodopseudomonas TaxID=1073 RepID=METAS_RHOPL|nr:homoserine O-succinyltransferase [Rhodopseudomonas pseudopalustris]A0A1D3PCI9.1 RecName: Full=Homoserine O-succinyltransferase; Short=HST; AltName: Full=Homoserine transsuccinylase; Short=HTS [Rhodopseudomonas palustris]SCN13860.1 Homoserine O-succinyltransferase [Rhodopseudomonas pseudopalustris]SEO29049.1 homoserine O-succinyltransferase [Rhodopseudomonas pseudopalustris]
MTLLFDKTGPIDSPTLAPASVDNHCRSPDRSAAARVIEIGLVNNMSDAALRATERQFMRLLRAGSGEHLVRLHCFALPSVQRSPATRQRIDSLYADIADLRHTRLDALIVTGAEPRAATLQSEPYWDEMRALVDWAEANTRSTIWSCLAAHAAVLHLDGIERERLPQKCSGVFAGEQVNDDALLSDLPSPLKVPHSRLNDLAADRLAARGYEVLTHAPNAGVDIFARQGRSRFVFFQGHPEYDATSLQREYLRDIGRFLTGERHDYPEFPVDYFDADIEDALDAFRAEAEAARDPAIIARLPHLALRQGTAEGIETTANALFRNWLISLASEP